MVVEPRGGFPTKVDREYVIIQSEFYTKLDPDGRKIDGQSLYVLDTDGLRAKKPTYTVFNGQYNGMVRAPLTAKPDRQSVVSGKSVSVSVDLCGRRINKTK